MAEGNKRETLVAFESGHYKKITGSWKGDSVWAHFRKDGGGMVHINKDKVEYMESFEDPEEFNAHKSDYPEIPSNISNTETEPPEYSLKGIPGPPKRSHHGQK